MLASVNSAHLTYNTPTDLFLYINDKWSYLQQMWEITQTTHGMSRHYCTFLCSVMSVFTLQVSFQDKHFGTHCAVHNTESPFGISTVFSRSYSSLPFSQNPISVAYNKQLPFTILHRMSSRNIYPCSGTLRPLHLSVHQQ